ncbi:hypothetical protein CMV_018719 [Castanea mollissima]|uniref:Uncharacterized protein n=1 Tax=Castanea mollissima TaxID=60419 RepID=A0A8J4VNG2_9ROSI|nr:hypothetical protein CMV_018719 [Castanea mollissima]
MSLQDLGGPCDHQSGANCEAATTSAATQEALVGAALKAKSLGYFRILFLCSNSSIVQGFRLVTQNVTRWQEKTDCRSFSFTTAGPCL